MGEDLQLVREYNSVTENTAEHIATVECINLGCSKCHHLMVKVTRQFDSSIDVVTIFETWFVRY